MEAIEKIRALEEKLAKQDKMIAAAREWAIEHYKHMDFNSSNPFTAPLPSELLKILKIEAS